MSSGYYCYRAFYLAQVVFVSEHIVCLRRIVE